MSVDPLADWWVHEVTVERWQAESAYGPGYAAPQTVTGFYSDKTIYEAGQVVGAGRFAFPATVAYIPVQSRITLPAQFGGVQRRVVSVAIGAGGGRPTPDHQELTLL